LARATWLPGTAAILLALSLEANSPTSAEPLPGADSPNQTYGPQATADRLPEAGRRQSDPSGRVLVDGQDDLLVVPRDLRPAPSVNVPSGKVEHAAGTAEPDRAAPGDWRPWTPAGPVPRGRRAVAMADYPFHGAFVAEPYGTGPVWFDGPLRFDVPHPDGLKSTRGPRLLSFPGRRALDRPARMNRIVERAAVAGEVNPGSPLRLFSQWRFSAPIGRSTRFGARIDGPQCHRASGPAPAICFTRGDIPCSGPC
jgi:hypothetical protein